MSPELRWLLTVVGLVIGGIVTVAGLALLNASGPVILIVGLIFLAFGAAGLFTRTR